MIQATGRVRALSTAAAAALLGLALGACSTPKSIASTTPIPLEQAAAQATQALVEQTRAWPAALDPIEPRRRIVLDPMIEARSGQRTEATQLLQMLVREQLGASAGRIELLPFQTTELAKATHVLTGTMTREVGQAGEPVRIQVALTDLRSGKVAAQASAVARDDGLNSTPSAADSDSPVLPQERVIEGYVRTTASAPGEAADPDYLARIAVAPVVNEALADYSAGRYEEALARFDAVAALPTGDQLRVLSGRYLALVRLERLAEARQAFGQIVGYGIRSRQLGVKFLFTPGSTEFWPDPQVSGQYPMWLSEMASASTASPGCLHVVGHTSRTGTEAFNDTLSLQRAGRIRDLLSAQAPVLAQRTQALGKGFRENIIGSGTDNAVDALDRRVEFKLVPCP